MDGVYGGGEGAFVLIWGVEWEGCCGRVGSPRGGA